MDIINAALMFDPQIFLGQNFVPNLKPEYSIVFWVKMFAIVPSSIFAIAVYFFTSDKKSDSA